MRGTKKHCLPQREKGLTVSDCARYGWVAG